MEVFVPHVARVGRDCVSHEDAIRLDNQIAIYFGFLLRQIKGIRNILHATTSFTQTKASFLEDAVLTRAAPCKNDDTTVILQEYRDTTCQRGNGASTCSTANVRPYPNDGGPVARLTQKHHFKLNNQCFQNMKKISRGVCPDFLPFLPMQATPLIGVLRVGCVYELELHDDSKLVLSLATQREDTGTIVLHALSVLNDQPPKTPDISQPRYFHEFKLIMNTPQDVLLPPGGRVIEVHTVKRFRGPAIINKYITLEKNRRSCISTLRNDIVTPSQLSPAYYAYTRHDGEPALVVPLEEIVNTLIPVVKFSSYVYTDPSLYTDVILKNGYVTFPLHEFNKFIRIIPDGSLLGRPVIYEVYYNYRIASEHVTGVATIRCGLSSYIRGRMRYNHLVLRDFKLETNSPLNLQVHDSATILLKGKTAYYQSHNPKFVDLSEVWDDDGHELDALLSLQRYFQGNRSMHSWEVRRNKHLYHNSIMGGTPSGIIYNTQDGDHPVGVVDVRIRPPGDVQLHEEIEVKFHTSLVGTVLGGDKLCGFFVQWSLSEVRITQFHTWTDLTVMPQNVNPPATWVDHLVENFTANTFVLWNTARVLGPNTSGVIVTTCSTCIAPLHTPDQRVPCLVTRVTNHTSFQEVRDDELRRVKLRPKTMNATGDLEEAMRGHLLGRYDAFRMDTTNALWRAAVPVTFGRVSDLGIELQDEFRHFMTIRRIPLVYLREVPYFKHMGDADILVALLHSGISVVPTGPDGSCADLTIDCIILKSDPMFVDSAEVDALLEDQVIVVNTSVEGVELLRIQTDKYIYTTLRTQSNGEEGNRELAPVTTDTIVRVGDFVFKNYYISRTTRSTEMVEFMEILHNINAGMALAIHIETYRPQTCNAKFWRYILNQLECHLALHIRLNIAGSVIRDGNDVSRHFWDAFDKHHAFRDKSYLDADSPESRFDNRTKESTLKSIKRIIYCRYYKGTHIDIIWPHPLPVDPRRSIHLPLA